MNYLDFYLLADAIVAEKFEGSPARGAFTEEDWYYIRNAQKVVLIKSFDNLARKLLASRNFEMPVKHMAEKVQALLQGTETRDSLRFVLQSEHDTHIVNSVTWLQPVDHEYVDMPFASTLVVELHYDQECLTKVGDTSCFTVEVYNNGDLLKLDTCLNANKARSSTSPVCQYEDFMTHYRARLPRGGDLQTLCRQGYDPYPMESARTFLQI